jgi:segregation and condensation protein A
MGPSPEEVQLMLPVFSGPLGDLLELVDRGLISVEDLPVAEVVRQCLAYSLGDVAQEATLVALCCRLVLAKARAVTRPPARPMEPIAVVTPDMRRYEEVRQGLQPAVAALEDLAARGWRSFRRRHRVSVPAGPPPPEAVPLEALAELARRRLKELADEPHYQPDAGPTIQEMVARVLEVLEGQRRVAFSQLMALCRDRLEVILTFLAVLELMRQGVVDAQQEEAFAEIWIEAV